MCVFLFLHLFLWQNKLFLKVFSFIKHHKTNQKAPAVLVRFARKLPTCSIGEKPSVGLSRGFTLVLRLQDCPKPIQAYESRTVLHSTSVIAFNSSGSFKQKQSYHHKFPDSHVSSHISVYFQMGHLIRQIDA